MGRWFSLSSVGLRGSVIVQERQLFVDEMEETVMQSKTTPSNSSGRGQGSRDAGWCCAPCPRTTSWMQKKVLMRYG